MSLRTRLLAGMAVVAIVLVVVAVGITRATHDQLLGQLDDRLVAATGGDRFGFFERSGEVPPPREDLPFTPPERQSDLYEGLLRSDGELTTFFAPNLGGEELSPPAVEPGDVTFDDTLDETVLLTVGAVDGDTTYRVLARPVGDGVWLTALPLDDLDDTLQRLVVIEVVATILILAVLGLVTWWVVRLGIRPIKEMTTTASQIAAGDLTVRVPESSPGTESGDLAAALNTMLGRIERSFDEQARSEERLRRFVADASHELRTPVTTIRGYAELYRHGGLADPGALDDAMRRTEQEALRMGRLVEDMLLLAKLDEERPLARQPVDLAAIARDAVADAAALASDRAITVEATESAIVTGDEDRLRQVVANVMGNALVHTEPGTPIDVRVEVADGEATLEVEDHGQGMPTEVAARVTERFYRADPSRARHRGGSGLGLSIADSTVAAHGGRLEIDSEPGRGTIVRLVVPASSPSPVSG